MFDHGQRGGATLLRCGNEPMMFLKSNSDAAYSASVTNIFFFLFFMFISQNTRFCTCQVDNHVALGAWSLVWIELRMAKYLKVTGEKVGGLTRPMPVRGAPTVLGTYTK